MSLLRLADVSTFFAGLRTNFALPASATDGDFQLKILAAVAKVRWWKSSHFPLTVTPYSVCVSPGFQYGLWEVFESEWRELKAGQHFARSNRRVIQGRQHDTAMLWRVLDFYCLVASILPPDDVVSIMMEEKPPVPIRHADACQTGMPHGGAAMLRHSRFNPTLLKRRLVEAEGAYVYAQRTDKL